MKRCLLILVAFFMSLSLKAQFPKAEHDALIYLYQATNGPEWFITGDSTTEQSHWNGVRITNNGVTGIDLSHDNLKGTLPESLRNLSNLHFLELYFNQLEGELPKSFNGIYDTESVVHNTNHFDRKRSDNIFDQENPEVLVLASNHLTGPLLNNLAKTSDLQKCILMTKNSQNINEFYKI